MEIDPSKETLQTQQNIPESEKNKIWALCCQLSPLLMLLGIPLANILFPLIIWLIRKKESPFMCEIGRRVLNFQISMTLYMLACSFILIFSNNMGGPHGYLFLNKLLSIFFFALLSFNVVSVVIASIKARKGILHDFQFSISFLKK